MDIKRVCLVGGTGFVGRHLVYRLANEGISCRVITRNPPRHHDLRATRGVELVPCDLFDNKALAGVFRGCDAVINLVGILNQNGHQRFRRLHVELADTVVEACHMAKVRRLLHMSALNADEASGVSLYLRTKGEAENRVHTKGHPDIAVTSFRPSVIFGTDDSFINRFAGLLRLPGPFPLACPQARFAPVYVGDVAAAMAASLRNQDTFNKHFELCGPQSYTLQEIVRYVADNLGIAKWILPLSDGLSVLQARILERLPGKPFSHDNYLSMQVDSICKQGGLQKLGISPTHMDTVIPQYLRRQDRLGRLDNLRRVIG